MILRNINKPLNFQWAFKVAMLGFQNHFNLIFSFTATEPALQYMCSHPLQAHKKMCLEPHPHFLVS
jgi:hypothetical protein